MSYLNENEPCKITTEGYHGWVQGTEGNGHLTIQNLPLQLLIPCCSKGNSKHILVLQHCLNINACSMVQVMGLKPAPLKRTAHCLALPSSTPDVCRPLDTALYTTCTGQNLEQPAKLALRPSRLKTIRAGQPAVPDVLPCIRFVGVTYYSPDMKKLWMKAND